MHGHISGVWWVQPVNKRQQRKQVTAPRAFQIHTTRYEKMRESIQVGHAAYFLTIPPPPLALVVICFVLVMMLTVENKSWFDFS